MSFMLNSNDWATLSFRLGLALLVGCLIGLNRQQGGRPAGIRTFMLVSMGAALFVMIPLQAEGDSPYAATNALSRTIPRRSDRCRIFRCRNDFAPIP
jgi:putative Mg2+ transporter-C (MgtC) family protein